MSYLEVRDRAMHQYLERLEAKLDSIAQGLGLVFQMTTQIRALMTADDLGEQLAQAAEEGLKEGLEGGENV